MDLPITIYENKDNLFLSQRLQDYLKAFPRSILWINKGQYGMIPKEVILNELSIRADRKRLWDLEPHHGKWKSYWEIPLGFNWSEARDVPNGSKILELLEQYSDESGTKETDESHD